MSHYISKKLGDLTSYISKGIPPKYVDKSSDSTILVLNQKCNRDFSISYEQARYHDVSLKSVPSEKIIRIGDVLINSTGEGTAGRVAQINDLKGPTTFDGHMILIRPRQDLDPTYFGYAIKSFQKEIESFAEGSTGQTEINRTRLLNDIVITFPEEIKEQRLIASSLKALDEKISVNNQINKNLVA